MLEERGRGEFNKPVADLMTEGERMVREACELVTKADNLMFTFSSVDPSANGLLSSSSYEEEEALRLYGKARKILYTACQQARIDPEQAPCWSVDLADTLVEASKRIVGKDGNLTEASGAPVAHDPLRLFYETASCIYLGIEGERGEKFRSAVVQLALLMPANGMLRSILLIRPEMPGDSRITSRGGGVLSQAEFDLMLDTLYAKPSANDWREAGDRALAEFNLSPLNGNDLITFYNNYCEALRDERGILPALGARIECFEKLRIAQPPSELLGEFVRQMEQDAHNASDSSASLALKAQLQAARFYWEIGDIEKASPSHHANILPIGQYSDPADKIEACLHFAKYSLRTMSKTRDQFVSRLKEYLCQFDPVKKIEANFVLMRSNIISGSSRTRRNEIQLLEREINMLHRTPAHVADATRFSVQLGIISAVCEILDGEYKEAQTKLIEAEECFGTASITGRQKVVLRALIDSLSGYLTFRLNLNYDQKLLVATTKYEHAYELMKEGPTTEPPWLEIEILKELAYLFARLRGPQSKPVQSIRAELENLRRKSKPLPFQADNASLAKVVLLYL